MDAKSPDLGILVAEYNRVATLISDSTELVQKISSVGLAILSAAFVYGWQGASSTGSNGEPAAPALVVFAAFGALTMAIIYVSVIIENLGRGGYAKCLERQINGIVGHPVLFWENLPKGKIHVLPWIPLNLAFAILTFLATALGMWVAWSTWVGLVGVLLVIGLGLLVIGLCVSAAVLLRAYDAMFDVAEKHIRDQAK